MTWVKKKEQNMFIWNFLGNKFAAIISILQRSDSFDCGMCVNKRRGGDQELYAWIYMYAFLCLFIRPLCVVWGYLYICVCVQVCMHACVFILHCSPLLGTPLLVFFSSVNSWLLEQNNCHFPASGSKVIQHNEMYKKEGGMADRRHAKSNVERSE